jgi:6-phosphogluconolactonase/glucosamine-6-phosphate isomerase/deaminase
MDGRHVPSEGLSLNTADEKTCTMTYQTLFRGLGIDDGNTGIYITPTQFMKGSFMLIFDLTLDGCASDGHTSLLDNGNTRIELIRQGSRQNRDDPTLTGI